MGRLVAAAVVVDDPGVPEEALDLPVRKRAPRVDVGWIDPAPRLDVLSDVLEPVLSRTPRGPYRRCQSGLDPRTNVGAHRIQHSPPLLGMKLGG